MRDETIGGVNLTTKEIVMKNKQMVHSKTFWTGLAGVVSAVGGYMTGTMDPGTAIQTAIGSLTAIFLRSGIRENSGINRRLR